MKKPWKRDPAIEFDVFAGIKNNARRLRRYGCKPVRVKNPDKYLNSHARQMKAFKAAIMKAVS